MKKVTRFMTDDGEVFATTEQATNHENEVRLCAWYEDNKLYGMYEGCRIEWPELIEWCSTNREKVQAILNACD